MFCFVDISCQPSTHAHPQSYECPRILNGTWLGYLQPLWNWKGSLTYCALFWLSKFNLFEHIELPAKLLDYFLRINKSNINQSINQDRVKIGRVDVSLNINLQEKYCITHEVDRQRTRVDTDIWDVFTSIYSVTGRCLACDDNVWYTRHWFTGANKQQRNSLSWFKWGRKYNNNVWCKCSAMRHHVPATVHFFKFWVNLLLSGLHLRVR